MEALEAMHISSSKHSMGRLLLPGCLLCSQLSLAAHAMTASSACSSTTAAAVAEQHTGIVSAAAVILILLAGQRSLELAATLPTGLVTMQETGRTFSTVLQVGMMHIGQTYQEQCRILHVKRACAAVVLLQISSVLLHKFSCEARQVQAFCCVTVIYCHCRCY
jgi:mannose/fructose/N-acetylgalactosamine-specific phosphotransferase system component IIC